MVPQRKILARQSARRRRKRASEYNSALSFFGND
jgi:hypothetical protein